MRKLLGFVVVLAVLLVGADFGARYLAVRQVGDAVQTRLGLAERPDVAISGFPFLTQAVQGRYDSIRATLPAVTVGPLGAVRVAVVLNGVRLPLSDAISGDVDRLVADTGRVRLTIPTTAIAEAVGLPGLSITEENGDLVVAARVTVLGREFPVTARLDAAVSDSVLSLRSGALSGAGITLPTQVTAALQDLVDLAVPLDTLPFTVTSGDVSVVGTDVIVEATTSGLDLAVR